MGRWGAAADPWWPPGLGPLSPELAPEGTSVAGRRRAAWPRVLW